MRGQHRRRCGPEVVEALEPLWKASDRLCGKRLHAPLPQLVESLEHHGHLQLEPSVRLRVLTMSRATIDRLLAPVRQSSGGNGCRRHPRAHSGVRRRIQVRTFKGWDDHKPPGWLRSTWWPNAASAWRGGPSGPWWPPTLLRARARACR